MPYRSEPGKFFCVQNFFSSQRQVIFLHSLKCVIFLLFKNWNFNFKNFGLIIFFYTSKILTKTGMS